MAEVDYKKPALIGGAVAGLLSVMPILQTLSLCFCLWAWVGGGLAAKLLIDGSPEPVPPREGARIGLFAGLFAALIFFLIETPLMIWQMAKMLESAANIVKDPQAIEVYHRIGQSMGLKIGFAIVTTGIGALFTIGFSVLGGMLGVKLFEKRQNQTPPPQQWQPPQSGDGGDWPQQ
ncbi:MAG: hypothetical protein AAB401_05600 [Acidobacteriota bacterium]